MRHVGAVVSMALGVAVGLSGCWIRSLHPIGGETDAVFDEALLGTWIKKGEKEDETEVAVFSRKEDKGYRLVHVRDGRAAILNARLVKVGEDTFLEVSPSDPPEAWGASYTVHLVPAFSFMRMSIGKESFSATPLDYKWLADGLKSGKIRLAHETVEGTPVLTASTEDLRTFLKKHSGKGEAFGSPMVYRRQ